MIYRVTLEASTGASPPLVRLKALLKTALRAHGFRCRAVEELGENPAEGHLKESPPLLPVREAPEDPE